MEQYHDQPTTDLFLQEPIVYAGFWERFGAALIDGIILAVPNFFFTFLLTDYPGLGNVLSLLIGWLYSALQESGPAQATVGKRAVSIKVTTLEGERISFGQATGRHFGKIISAIILFIGYLMMLWNDKRQTLHDQMAATLVVKS